MADSKRDADEISLHPGLELLENRADEAQDTQLTNENSRKNSASDNEIELSIETPTITNKSDQINKKSNEEFSEIESKLSTQDQPENHNVKES